jgi:carbonic anhydrase
MSNRRNKTRTMRTTQVTLGVVVTALALALLSSSSSCTAPVASGDHASRASDSVDADRALKLLMEGNERFVAGHRLSRDEPGRRAELARSQHPIAVIVSCSDSRVPPEIVFDQTLGDLFDVRTAGHVVGDLELGSIEYAAEHLHTPLIVVLGHQRCGAVTAAVSAAGHDPGDAEGHIAAIVKAIGPAVDHSKSLAGDAVENAMRANVRETVRQLRTSDPILSHLVHDGKLKVVGGRYDLDSGKVEILPADAAAAAAAADTHK